MGDDSDWLTWPQAADLVGCSVTTIEYCARAGRFVRRPGRGRRGGSLQRQSVEEFAHGWLDRQWQSETKGAPPRRARSSCRILHLLNGFELENAVRLAVRG